MASSDIITAIDIGTTKICTIVARNDRNNNIVDIIDYSFAPCEGLKKGNVEDIYLSSDGLCSSSISDCVSKATNSIMDIWALSFFLFSILLNTLIR